jgi:Copper resistance protein D
VKELTSTTWGEALTVKIALWVTVLMIATLNAVTLVPRMADRAARSHERWSAGEKLGSAMRLELVGGLALVAVASLMAASPQPAAVEAASTFATTAAVEQASTTARTSRAGYDLRVRTVRVGTSGRTATVFRVRLSTEGTPASAPRADAVLLGADGVDRGLSLQLVGAGEWLSDRLDVAPGSYRLTPRFLRAGVEVALPVRVQVP